jgi:outer membrane protein
MNKLLIVLFVLVLGTTTVHAQTTSGNMMLGGGFEYRSTSNQASNDANDFYVYPSFGYFLSDNLALGATLSIGSEHSGTGNFRTVGTSFGFGPFVRYYLPTSNENFRFFGEGEFLYFTGKDEFSGGNVVKYNQTSFLLKPGAAYFFNEHWALEFEVTLFGITTGDPNTDIANDKSTAIQFGLETLSPSLGFRYHF